MKVLPQRAMEILKINTNEHNFIAKQSSVWKVFNIICPLCGEVTKASPDNIAFTMDKLGYLTFHCVSCKQNMDISYTMDEK